MMNEVQPGRHPNFDITIFDPVEQRVLRRMEQIFHLTRDGEIAVGKQKSSYRYALVKPCGKMRGILHTDREVLVVFSAYEEFQPRSIDAFDHIMEQLPEAFRIEKVARILVSGDVEIRKKLRSLFESRPDAPVVIPYHYSEFSLATLEADIVSRMREFSFSRDLFSMSSPLRSELYFYGRSDLINEISSKLSSGENFGLFGLRRSGKTSLISGISRALSTRSGASVTIDCQSPSVHQLHWNELLHHIASELKHAFSVKHKIGNVEAYGAKNAATTFLEDIRVIGKQAKKEFVAVLFDEIERIAPGTASSSHWNNERDFLLFWQSMRAAFQSSSSPIVYLIVGTNPHCIEAIKLFESDNPLYGNVEKRFIPMFTPDQISEMVADLGGIMGVEFDAESRMKLFQDFGGHPFLTRYACSFIAKSAGVRPVKVDRTLYARGVNEYTTEAESYVASVVGLLEEQYPDEHLMLEYIGQGDLASFEALAQQDQSLLEHLYGYGVLKKGIEGSYFNIGVVEQYFANKAKPVKLLSTEDRLAEISKRRNSLERKIRVHVGTVFSVHFSRAKRRVNLVSKLMERRRTDVAGVDFDSLLAEGASPLYFDELKSIILGFWDKFEHSLEMNKSEFEYHMEVVNKARYDAHAKDVQDHDFEKARVSLVELESKF
ncbi:AAA-like domain-containing protein [Pontibaca salina]|uniref:ATP-binding protein n=1 Tax=Pontibaca salina TaxID=2795731 RepID=A0A934HHL7_9RHOB|nr:ATP-binding protein [Pontibaca salina]MBI6628309.1 ATP-binding protein [Pontibaca salina]